MSAPRRQFDLDSVALALFAATCVSALALAQATRPAWILAVLCLASLFIQIPRVHPIVAAWSRYLAWTLLGSAVLLGLVLMAYPILSMQVTTRLILLEGYGLGIFTLLFLFGRRTWPAPSALIPTALGTLMVACFNPSASLRVNLVMAGIALFAWLALPSPHQPSSARERRWQARPLALLAAIALATFLTAWGIIRLLPWAQTEVERATFQSYMEGATHYSIFSPESTLGDIARLKLSKKVVMRVWSSRPQKLRGRVFTAFNGSDWRSQPSGIPKARSLTTLPAATGDGADLEIWLDSIPGNLYLLPGHKAEEAAKDAIRTRVLPTGSNEGMVLMPGQTVMLRIRAGSLQSDEAGELLPPLFAGSGAYGLINRRHGNVVDSSEASPQLIRECLAVPEDTDQRVRELVARLTQGAATPDDRIHSTLQYLVRECHYSLEVGSFHSKQPVAEFLFEKKRGYCQYFASAAALLLRLEGVPCRYVTGFNIEEDNRQGDHYVVREMDAHAWIEAYVAGRGWLELDPTPESEHEMLQASLGGGWWADAGEWLASLMAELALRFQGITWGTAWRELGDSIRGAFRWMCLDSPLRSLLFLGMLFIFTKFVRRRRHVPSPGAPAVIPFPTADAIPADLRALIHQVDELWADNGHARPASRAPLEHLRGIPAGKLSPQIREASGRIVDYFYRCCFGGLPVVPAEINKLHQALEQARKP